MALTSQPMLSGSEDFTPPFLTKQSLGWKQPGKVVVVFILFLFIFFLTAPAWCQSLLNRSDFTEVHIATG